MRPRPLRLVHVTTIPETLAFMQGQAGFLARRGFEVVAVSSPGGALARFAAREGVRSHGVAMERRISPARDLAAVARLALLFRRLRPDVVDAHTPKAGLLAMLAARAAGVPVRIYHLHGLVYVTARGPRRRLLAAAERLAAALATRVLCVSRSLAEVAIADGVAPARKVRVILSGSINGVDSERFTPASPAEREAARRALGIPGGARVAGFVGRLAREKGVVELAAAWRALRRELPDLRLVLVGPGEPRDPLPPEVEAELRSDPRVVFAGFDWETRPYYRAMDVVALPSHREGFGVVSIEAAAMGLPVVATRIPGCVDAVRDGITGTLVPARDDAALRDALRAYLLDPGLRARHGEAGRARAVREFQRERVWEALHDEYLSAAAAARPGLVAAPPSPRAAAVPDR